MLQLGFFPTAGEPGAFPAVVPAVRQGLPRQGRHPMARTWRWARSARGRRQQTRAPRNRSVATSRGKSRGVPHTTVLQRPGPPCRLGKGQSWGHGTCCHYLRLALPGSTAVADSTSRTPQSCLGSSARLCPPARAAGPRGWGGPGCCSRGFHLAKALPPGEQPSLHISGIGPARVSIHGVTQLSSFVPLRGGQGTPQSPCTGRAVRGCRLLPAPGSSPEQILC